MLQTHQSKMTRFNVGVWAIVMLLLVLLTPSSDAWIGPALRQVGKGAAFEAGSRAFGHVADNFQSAKNAVNHIGKCSEKGAKLRYGGGY
jgi:hypothetical protein